MRLTARQNAGIAGALRRAGIADVDDGTRRRAEYSSDASNYRVVPAAVVFPRHIDDVLAAVDVARREGVPVTSRGGGTSTAGNAVGAGIVLDFSRHLNRVIAVDPEERTARVEPGTVLDDITVAGAPHGLRFGPDPSTHARATIGGSIGNNACGSRALAYGRTADNVTSLDVLTAAGERFTTQLRRGQTARTGDRPPAALLDGLDGIVRANLATIRTEFGRFSRQVSGYSMEHLLPENGMDLGRFLVGTEGTLTVVLGATVRLVEAPRATALAVLGYPDMPAAADAVPRLLSYCPAAIEGMDARLVNVVRRRRGDGAVPGLPSGGGWLLVETTGATQAEARAAAATVAAAAGAQGSLVMTGRAARVLWAVREDGAGLGGRSPSGAPAWPGWEDAAVPPERLGAYLRDFQGLMRTHGLDGLVYGHFGEGCVHARIDFPLVGTVGGAAALRAFVVDAAGLVGQHGGSMSGEHGDGRARGELLPSMYSEAAISLFAQVKGLFDPGDLFNPGVLVAPEPVDAHLRGAVARPLRLGGPLGFAYPQDNADLTTAVHRCVGVGKCRADSTADGGVMCPSYLATRDEKDSTRARSRVLQELAAGAFATGLRSREVGEALDLCLSCKGCSSDCPAGVDMATYKAEVLYHRYRRRLRPRTHYSLGWLPRTARLAAHAPRTANMLLASPTVARTLKWAAGIDERRPLPQFSRRTFRDTFSPAPVGSGSPVLLWVDTFTNHFAPQVGAAATRVLYAAGFRPELTSSLVCCGLTWISTGQLDGARRQLRRSLDALGPALAAGLPIVGLEPSCTAVLRHDLPRLLPDDPRAARVAAATKTLAELLTTSSWQPPALDGVRILSQPHCHQHAVMGWERDRALLEGAGAQVEAVGGCCGLAGNFGVEKGHHDISVKVAETALLPAVKGAAPGTVVLADGFSCRTQLNQLVGMEGHHLAELLSQHLP